MSVVEATRPPVDIAEAEIAEEYARSLYALRQLGRLAFEGAAAEEYEGAEIFAYDDFSTAVAENLKTDSEARHLLDIEPTKVFEIRDGRVVAPDGRDMEELVQEGWDTSRKAAETDPRMKTQVTRDEGDILTIRIVNDLRPGESYTAVSMDPKDAMARDGRKFWEGKGYRAGLAFIQYYYKHPDGGLLSGSYSVEFSDEAAWRAVLARRRVTVPADVSADNWIRHGDRRTMTPEQAKTHGTDLRGEYYEEVGKTHRRVSVTELLQQRKEVVDRYFNTYMRPLAHAIATGENNQAMQSFAATLTRSADVTQRLAAKSRQELIRVSNGKGFTAESGRLMEELVRYATVEELRKDLMLLLSGQQIQRMNHTGAATYDKQLEFMNQQAAGNIGGGFAAGRSYGGCSPAGEDAADEANARENPQDVFGGKGREDDAKIPDRIRCIECRKESPKAQVIKAESWRCPHCTYEIDVCTGAVLHESKLSAEQEVRLGQVLGVVLEAFIPKAEEALNYN
jgi:hypothetical protein